ncbi:MAG TPA: hypothetical protein VHZ95_12245 [Polyangiales bacterium]|nr:hypothetical protein [Polyangiales bacterium]
MTPMLLAWLVSLSGAALFFAAGDIWSRQRKTQKEAGAISEIGDELEATRAHMLEQERSKQLLRAHESQLAGEISRRDSEFEQLRTEATRRDSAVDQLRAELNDARAQAETLERELTTARAELRRTHARTAPAVSGPPAPIGDFASKQLKRIETERDLLAQQLERVHAEREVLVKQVDAERSSGQRQVAASSHELEEVQARLLALTNRKANDAQTAALQQELSLTRESLRSRDTQLEQLREETVRLRRVEVELERSKRELSELAEQTRSLRAEAYASHRPPTIRRSERPATISTRGNALQLIVDDETEHRGARSAVIADELGLLVAASGVGIEYGEALAAFGAYLADVGTRTRDMLPLQELRQVVVRDDHDMTLTVRPLATEDPGLALVTLAIDVNTASPVEGRLT